MLTKLFSKKYKHMHLMTVYLVEEQAKKLINIELIDIIVGLNSLGWLQI